MSNRYDQLPYRGKAYPYAHPERLAAVAKLFGVAAPDIRSARVLEIGCGDGFNVMSMAYQYPGSTFVGVDPAGQAILQGTLKASSLGLDNLTLVEGGAEDIDASNQRFDYIVVHGVYSWVSPDIQASIMQLIGTSLSDTGIAYVSYNTLPGWHVRAVARDLMLSVVDRKTPPEQQVAAAREVLSQFASGLSESSLHGEVIRATQELLSEHEDAYWFHDFLSPENHAYTVSEFVEQATEHGLQFLAEAELGDSMIDKIPSQLRPVVEMEVDRLRREQLIDHLSNRSFRRTLLCRAHHTLTVGPDPANMGALHFAMKGYVDGDVDLTEGTEVSFIRRDGEHIVVDNSLVKAALGTLCAAQPASVPHDELMADAEARTGITIDESLRSNLQQVLLFLHGSELIDILPSKRSVCLTVAERPQVCRLARWDAMQGEYPITNALHSASAVTPFEQLIIVLCDGTRTVEDLIDVLTDAVNSGDIHIETTADQELTPEVIRDTLEHQVSAALTRLPGVGLLEIAERRAQAQR